MKKMTPSMKQFKEIAKQIEFPLGPLTEDATRYKVPIEDMHFDMTASAGTVQGFNNALEKVRAHPDFVRHHSSRSECGAIGVVIINRYTMRTENPKRTMVITFSEDFDEHLDECRYQILFEGWFRSR